MGSDLKKQQTIDKGLAKAIESIARSYRSKYQDDIRQACWLEVLQLQAKGKTSKRLLIKSAYYAARGELKRLTNSGMKPVRSPYPPPQKVEADWIHGFEIETEEVCEWVEPTYQTVESSSDAFRNLYALTTTSSQRAVLFAYKQLLAEQEWDADCEVTQTAAATLLGVPPSTVSRISIELRELYTKDLNSDN